MIAARPGLSRLGAISSLNPSSNLFILRTNVSTNRLIANKIIEAGGKSGLSDTNGKEINEHKPDGAD